MQERQINMLKSPKFKYISELSSGGAGCDNVLIKGDNMEVLPSLSSLYGGRVKCVYIDPPYNNGDNYHYYNDSMSEELWLRNIRTVLSYLRLLLTPDGSVWISIDDKEMAYLKVEADKVFGRENYVATIIWQQRKSRENRAAFSNNHEYVLVYAKDIRKFKKSRNLLPLNEDFIDNRYKNPDNDPRGPWQSVTASVQAGHAVPSQFYTVVSPEGVEHNPPKGRCWVYNELRMKDEIARGNIWFGLTGRNAPRIKKFLKDAKIGLTPQTLWVGDEYGTTDSAKKHLLALFPGSDKIFDTPKPEELIKGIIEIASNAGDIVLDCYLGSGTTLTAAHKLGRKYIGVECGEQMTHVVVNRLRQVIAGEQGGISQSVGWKGGGCFSYFEYQKNADRPLENLMSISSKYRQLDLYSLFDQFGEDYIVENNIVCENIVSFKTNSQFKGSSSFTKNVLIALVKKNLEKQFLDGSAIVYHTGKRFPSTIEINGLHYFIPYFKGKGIKNIWLVKKVRLGYIDNEKEDRNLRLIFQLEYLSELSNDFIPVDLKIWRTFTNIDIEYIDNLIDSND